MEERREKVDPESNKKRGAKSLGKVRDAKAPLSLIALTVEDA